MGKSTISTAMFNSKLLVYYRLRRIIGNIWGGSWNEGTFISWKILLKWMWGYPHFRKPPYVGQPNALVGLVWFSTTCFFDKTLDRATEPVKNHIVWRISKIGNNSAQSASYSLRQMHFVTFICQGCSNPLYRRWEQTIVFFLIILTGWWFGTWMDYDLPFSWECHNPNWRTHIFQRGRYTTNQLKVCWLPVLGTLRKVTVDWSD